MEQDRCGSAEELAELIDQLMADGSGHVNIFTGEGAGLTVDTVKSTEICGIKGACCQSTELSDEEED